MTEEKFFSVYEERLSKFIESFRKDLMDIKDVKVLCQEISGRSASISLKSQDLIYQIMSDFNISDRVIMLNGYSQRLSGILFCSTIKIQSQLRNEFDNFTHTLIDNLVGHDTNHNNLF